MNILNNGIDRNVWEATAKVMGFEPHDPALIVAVAERTDRRQQTVKRWYKLAYTPYPVHRKNALGKFAEILGLELPEKLAFKEFRSGKCHKKPAAPAKLVKGSPEYRQKMSESMVAHWTRVRLMKARKEAQEKRLQAEQDARKRLEAQRHEPVHNNTFDNTTIRIGLLNDPNWWLTMGAEFARKVGNTIRQAEVMAEVRNRLETVFPGQPITFKIG